LTGTTGEKKRERGGSGHLFFSLSRRAHPGRGVPLFSLSLSLSLSFLSLHSPRAIREAILAAGTSGSAPAGEYRGEKARTDYTAGFRRPDKTAGAEKGSGAHGPLRAPTAARTTVLVDYAPDICKDYKETGYCGYGDACKFMHDRGDYKAGWQIDADWEAKQKKEAAAAAAADAWAEEDGEEGGDSKGKGAGDAGGLPFACLGCRVAWHAASRPVVTPCRHYFCEACALASATSLCPACSKPTGGTFNAATAIEARIKKEAAEKEAAGGGVGAAEEEEEEEEDKGGWS
jgi:RING finger protein 113A